MDTLSTEATSFWISVNSLKERICSYRKKGFPIQGNEEKVASLLSLKWQEVERAREREREGGGTFSDIIVISLSDIRLYISKYVCINKVSGMATPLTDGFGPLWERRYQN